MIVGVRWTISDLEAKGIKISDSGHFVSKSGTNIPKSGKKLPQTVKGPGANALTKECLYYMNSLGYEVWRNNNAGIWDPQKKVFRRGSAKKGVSDIIGYHRKTGRAVYIEVKAGKDKLSKEQRQFLEGASKSGCLAFVYRSRADLERELGIL